MVGLGFTSILFDNKIIKMSDINPMDSVSNTYASTRKPKSVVWDHFKVSEVDKNKAICSHCPKRKNEFSYNNYGTQNLLKHLKTQHSFVFKDPQQPTISEVAFEKQFFSQDHLDQYLLEWIVKEDQPFTQLESEDFLRILNLLKPNVKVYSADTLKRRIMAEFEVKQNDLKNTLSQSNGKISFTTDCWTSSNNISFMGLTAHWIDDDWKLHAITLDFLHLVQSHTGIHLYEAFMKVIDSYDIHQKMLGVTLDNAANNNIMIQELAASNGSSFRHHNHIRCFAHVLNLGAQAALNVLTEDLERLRTLIKKIRSSPLSEEKFKSFQVDTTLKPILDVATRWNSTANMLERALILKGPLISFSCYYQSTKGQDLSLPADRWTEVERILLYLTPFRRFTNTICADTYPTLSLVVPMYNKLLNHLDSWMKDKTTPGEALHKSAVAANEKIYNYYNLTSDSYTVCTVLDPRFGISYYKRDTRVNAEAYEEVYDVVNFIYKNFYAPIDQVAPSAVVDEFDVFDIEPAVDEFKDYCTNSPGMIGSQNKDVLLWWKGNSKKYPNLSRMARDYLAIPATSASSERLFSSGKLMISDTRNSLSPSTIQACQFLKSWYKSTPNL